jgi:hypothetical protein
VARRFCFMAASVTEKRFNTEFTKNGDPSQLRANQRSVRQREKLNASFAQSLCYGYSNLRSSRRISMDADGLRANGDSASVAGDYDALFNDAQGLASGFGGFAY